MRPRADVMLVRLRPLPPRLRIVHLAALLRVARAAKAGSSLPLAGREGRSVAEARVGGILLYPHPAHRSPSLTMIHPPHKGEGEESARVAKIIRADLESELARLGPRKGEGEETATIRDGRAG